MGTVGRISGVDGMGGRDAVGAVGRMDGMGRMSRWVLGALLGARLGSLHTVGASPADAKAELLILGCSQGAPDPPGAPRPGGAPGCVRRGRCPYLNQNPL